MSIFNKNFWKFFLGFTIIIIAGVLIMVTLNKPY